MRISLLTIFPEFFDAPLKCSVFRIAAEKGILQVERINLRDFTVDSYRTVDDYPFGGGPGMIMKPEPIFQAVRAVRSPTSRVILLSPQGRQLTQEIVSQLADQDHLIFVCGRYKGVDARVGNIVDDELSIGDYVLSGGEAAALVVMEAVVRLLPGVVGDEESVNSDSFMNGLLDAPYYTRPREYEGYVVPEVLLSGDHARIQRWRRRQALQLTRQRRPDLFARYVLSAEDQRLLMEED